MSNKSLYLTRPQLAAELNRCMGCKNKPCMNACPVKCDPHDFIAKAKDGKYEQAVESIINCNPMGQTCGLVCPDKFCMSACTRAAIDFPLNIPKIQATILEKYRKIENKNNSDKTNGKKVAIIGAGPAGIAAASVLSKLGYKITIFECYDKIGGALNLIPDNRLPFEVVEKDWNYIYDENLIELQLNSYINNPEGLLLKGFDGIIIASGEPDCINLGVEGEEFALSYLEYLRNPQKYITQGNVAIIGGGAVATDCAVTAKQNGAENVEMFIRRRISDMRITNEERNSLLDNSIDLTSMTKVNKISPDNGFLTIYTSKTQFNAGKLEEIPQTQISRPNFSLVIKAIGSSAPRMLDSDKIIYAGDCKNGGSTLVEALASGKQAANNLDTKLK